MKSRLIQFLERLFRRIFKEYRSIISRLVIIRLLDLIISHVMSLRCMGRLCPMLNCLLTQGLEGIMELCMSNFRILMLTFSAFFLHQRLQGFYMVTESSNASARDSFYNDNIDYSQNIALNTPKRTSTRANKNYSLGQ